MSDSGVEKKALNEAIRVYKLRLDEGDIQVAYRGLVQFVSSLRSGCAQRLGPDYSVGNLLQGYMDYSYFYFVDSRFKARQLKLGVVLNHEKMRFELWLLGQTKRVQAKYWELLQGSEWIQGSVMPEYSVCESVLVEAPDFDDPAALRDAIESGLVAQVDRIFEAVLQAES